MKADSMSQTRSTDECIAVNKEF